MKYTGLPEHPLYWIRASMLQRCYDKNIPGFKWWGGRGISVCAEWKASAAAFIEWGVAAGWKPGLTLERNDNDGNYCPGNCRWATKAEQAQNRSSTKLTIEDILVIRTMLSDGVRKKSIASLFKVSERHVYYIQRKTTWKNIT